MPPFAILLMGQASLAACFHLLFLVLSLSVYLFPRVLMNSGYNIAKLPAWPQMSTQHSNRMSVA